MQVDFTQRFCTAYVHKGMTAILSLTSVSQTTKESLMALCAVLNAEMRLKIRGKRKGFKIKGHFIMLMAFIVSLLVIVS